MPCACNNYRVLNTPLEMDLPDVRDAVRRAFDVWQEQIPRTFTEIFSGTADIMLSFGENYHGDPYPFDGPSGTLAHAFGPYAYGTDPLEGDVHFDDAEFFTVRTHQGKKIIYPFIFDNVRFYSGTTSHAYYFRNTLFTFTPNLVNWAPTRYRIKIISF